MLLIDIAHAHSEVMRRAVEAVRARFPEVELVCGNVATAEGAAFLRDLGADAIKVGVGPGRGCRTRLETGAGVPQLQAIREAWCAVEETVPIIADGGVREDKDVFLALVAGASAVMLGSLLSGTDEAPGQIIEDPGTGEKRKIYRGMTSPQAVFRALYDDEEPDAVEAALEVPAEGQEMQVPYRGRWWTSSGGSAGICAPPSATAGRSRSPSSARRSCRTPSATWSRSPQPPAPSPTSAERGRLGLPNNSSRRSVGGAEMFRSQSLTPERPSTQSARRSSVINV